MSDNASYLELDDIDIGINPEMVELLPNMKEASNLGLVISQMICRDL